MSNLRILGMTIGIFFVLFAMLYFRGPRWRRLNFLLVFGFGVFSAIISLNPSVVNIARDTLALEDEAWGRLIALLVLSNFALWFLVFYMKFKHEKLKNQFERIVTALSLSASEIIGYRNTAMKPIMIVIPAFNEAENLRKLLPQIPTELGGQPVGVLVIDDGSSDGTASVVRELGGLCVSALVNRGQGAASRLGYQILKNSQVAIGVTMDADNQHLPEDLGRLITPIAAGDADLVIGSRILGRAEKASMVRLLGVFTFSKAISMLSGKNITDCSSGFKAFNREWLAKVSLQEDQFQAAEVIFESVKKGLRVLEVPITVAVRHAGTTKKGGNVSYGFNFLKVIAKTWFR